MIYSAARTVVDLMRLRQRLREPLAPGALRRYLRRRNARPGEVLSLAARWTLSDLYVPHSMSRAPNEPTDQGDRGRPGRDLGGGKS
jgi:hypothetical protein